MIHTTIAGQFGSYALFDSNTNDELYPDDLEMTDEEYEEIVRESYSTGTAEGHVRLATGRLVYALAV